MELGEKLRQARLERRLTQEALAERLGVSRQTVSNWENNRSYPDVMSVIALSEEYSISLDDLLKGTGTCWYIWRRAQTSCGAGSG